jgi:hypothetical protein
MFYVRSQMDSQFDYRSIVSDTSYEYILARRSFTVIINMPSMVLSRQSEKESIRCRLFEKDSTKKGRLTSIENLGNGSGIHPFVTVCYMKRYCMTCTW